MSSSNRSISAALAQEAQEAPREAGVLALVLLAGPEDVEEPEADHRRLQPAGPLVLHEPVEEPLGEGVRVVRPLAGRLDAAHRRVAVHRGAGGVVERDLAPLAEPEPGLGVLEVVVEHPVGVLDQHVGVGADVEDHLDRQVAGGRLQPGRARLVVDQVGDPGALEVPPLLGLADGVHHQDVLVPGLVQGLHEVRADQSGAAGHDDHGVPFRACR
ncbi:MAG: hypothetical protein QM767_01385 [Anaeromyxobacter sp.]